MSSFDPERGAVLRREEVELAAAVASPERPRRRDDARDVLADLEAARGEAEQLRRQAREEAEVIRRRAYEEGAEAGRRAGYDAGFEAGRQEALQQLAAEANRILAAVATWERETRRRTVEQLAEIAARAAGVLYGEQIAADPDHPTRVVEQLLDEAGPHAVLRVEVSPLDLPAVLAAREAWAVSRPTVAGVSISADPGLARGACRVLTEGGWVERDWPARLDELVRQWQDAAGGPEGRGAA
jgi:flagellar assembly protein FliH